MLKRLKKEENEEIVIRINYGNFRSKSDNNNNDII